MRVERDIAEWIHDFHGNTGRMLGDSRRAPSYDRSSLFVKS